MKIIRILISPNKRIFKIKFIPGDKYYKTTMWVYYWWFGKYYCLIIVFKFL